MPKNIKKRHLMDYSIFIPYLILCVVGLIMVYSSTSYLLLAQGLNPAKSVINQTVFWILSLIVIGIMYKMKIDVFKNEKLVQLAIVVTASLLVIAYLFFKPVNGAKGWIDLGFLSIQPAELLKIVLIWYLALTLSKRQETIATDFMPTMKRPLWLVMGLIVAVAIMPDFGNAAVLTLLVLILLLASGVDYTLSFKIGASGILLSILAIQGMNLFGKTVLPKSMQYIYKRFAIYQNPFIDEFDTGHQMVNGYYAMFNGGLFGRGLGNSIEKKGFLKEAQTDYIFAIVVEELGLIVSMMILGLLIFMIARIILVGVRSRDPFNSLICYGVGSMLLIQIFVNLGGITGIIPLTGITFPFLSQGGSSLLVLSIGIGLVLNVSANEKRKRLMSYYNG
ncbi:cell division protein FtsW [Enterococcus phoeniculicola]|uniref:Probable peptidoglycan glycosyltransferase FtsW n=1 Tax=Enterococcus phoeniculicola ATCC BAA-412 TaxID=1158610 RepID=R3TQQ1_9ENTE|nr:FtsW/RodA/SpoVE family cell cycle protein [Enterococcus phoeniculicola]EOL43859.1 cell division protein FtsW [Enterococcus phoeniculicola ATCC BAA-412]EOT76777.1 cell division protein FtsW [Enterococcus phoeniculicola ATCC BAA-412]OJG69916.1 cell division protein FtsW [Enterococcus phoeniculicola]